MATDLVKVKVQGTKLLTPLQREVQSLQVTNAEEYIAADEMLTGIKRARAQWEALVEPVLKPLREAKTAADKLKREVDAPLAQLEEQVKGHMRHFKLEEQRQLAEQTRIADAAKAKLAQQDEELANRELKARTSQMRERLARQREQLQTQVETIETPVEVKGESQARKVKKARISNLAAFLRAAADEMEEPPAMAGAASYPLMVDSIVVSLVDAFRQNPEGVAKWPGIEVYEDIVIAGRRGA